MGKKTPTFQPALVMVPHRIRKDLGTEPPLMDTSVTPFLGSLPIYTRSARSDSGPDTLNQWCIAGTRGEALLRQALWLVGLRDLGLFGATPWAKRVGFPPALQLVCAIGTRAKQGQDVAMLTW